jgi:hypothetical protein
MKNGNSALKARLYAVSLLILAAGGAAAILIYILAGDDSDAALQAIFLSKPYVRELQRFGGKASVLFDELDRWFAGLWQGKSLAFTVGWLSLLASLGVFLYARHLERRD